MPPGSALPDSLDAIRAPTSKGEKRGKESKREEMGREGEGKGLVPPHAFARRQCATNVQCGPKSKPLPNDQKVVLNRIKDFQ